MAKLPWLRDAVAYSSNSPRRHNDTLMKFHGIPFTQKAPRQRKSAPNARFGRTFSDIDPPYAVLPGGHDGAWARAPCSTRWASGGGASRSACPCRRPPSPRPSRTSPPWSPRHDRRDAHPARLRAPAPPSLLRTPPEQPPKLQEATELECAFVRPRGKEHPLGPRSTALRAIRSEWRTFRGRPGCRPALLTRPFLEGGEVREGLSRSLLRRRLARGTRNPTTSAVPRAHASGARNTFPLSARDDKLHNREGQGTMNAPYRPPKHYTQRSPTRRARSLGGKELSCWQERRISDGEMEDLSCPRQFQGRADPLRHIERAGEPAQRSEDALYVFPIAWRAGARSPTGKDEDQTRPRPAALRHSTAPSAFSSIAGSHSTGSSSSFRAPRPGDHKTAVGTCTRFTSRTMRHSWRCTERGMSFAP